MEQLEKALKKLVSEGYKLKQQHGNPEWRKALEEAETVLIKNKKEKNGSLTPEGKPKA
jgi:hypothetical protein